MPEREVIVLTNWLLGQLLQELETLCDKESWYKRNPRIVIEAGAQGGYRAQIEVNAEVKS